MNFKNSLSVRLIQISAIRCTIFPVNFMSISPRHRKPYVENVNQSVSATSRIDQAQPITERHVPHPLKSTYHRTPRHRVDERRNPSRLADMAAGENQGCALTFSRCASSLDETKRLMARIFFLHLQHGAIRQPPFAKIARDSAYRLYLPAFVFVPRSWRNLDDYKDEAGGPADLR